VENLASFFFGRELSSYPNPFNPECYIPVSRIEDNRKRIKIKIYNLLGQLVREIEYSGVRGGKVYWDGRDSCGLEVPSGVYFYEVAGETVRKMMVLR
jgi:flagellar hook assembly protein FlgD